LENFRVRFAPSPTGKLHIGNARTAMFNYLLSRKYHGKFVLRIEDTDFERSTKESEISILQDLKWLGLEWDEGPDTEGPYKPYRQSDRFDIYNKFTQQLISQGDAYKCFCSAEDIEVMRQECIKENKQPRYNGKCRNLSKEEIEAKEKSGLKPSIRFKVEEGVNIVVNDLLRGKIEFNSSNIGGDFIIVRSDNVPVYNYIVVIDDDLMKITHVLRGEDHLSNTPKQILIAKKLSLNIPQYAHHALILGPDRAKLSKRHGITSVANYRDEGYLSEALFNYLSLLGWSSETGEEIFTKDELISQIDISRIGKSAAVFDFKKLRWINGIYIRNYDLDKLLTLIKPFLNKDYDISNLSDVWLKDVLEAIRGNLEVLSDIKEWFPIFYNETINYDDDCKDIIKQDINQTLINSLLSNIEKVDTLNHDSYNIIMKAVMEETQLKGKKLFMPVRVLITGKTKGVDLDKTMELIGKKRLIARIKSFRVNG